MFKALRGQTKRLDGIIVVDNDSKDSTENLVSEEFEEVTYIKLIENIGGAGGFNVGMKLAYEKGYDWIWIMDDDAIAAQDCLTQLFSKSMRADVIIPVQINSSGCRYGQGYWRGKRVLITQLNEVNIDLLSFAGPLINKKVVEKIGLPRKDFFIYGDDLEYGIRIRRAGLIVAGNSIATIYHNLGGKPVSVKRLGIESMRNPQQAWKFYYDARNTLLMLQNLKSVR